MKNKTLIALSVVAAFASTPALAGPEHIDDGMVDIELAKHRTASVINKKLAAQRVSVAATADEPHMIDITVFMNPTYLDVLSVGRTTDSNGKYYENGAQFAYDRVVAQVNSLNDTLAAQNVNARLRINYIGTIDLTVTPNDDADNRHNYEHRVFSDCFFYKNNVCSEQGKFTEQIEVFDAESDLFMYVRQYEANELYLGLASYMTGMTILDNYVSDIAQASGFGEESLESTRFGNQAYGVLAHEFGHILGGMHQVSESEPAHEGSNRAYACGKRDSAFYEYDENDITTKKMTLLAVGSGAPGDEKHPFFSDPDITVEGDVCGVAGEADNISVLRQNAQTAADYRQPVADLSSVGFSIDQQIVNRTENTATLTVTRTGDTSAPSYLTLIARDGTAWENRDFTFGIKELKFAAGETEKSVDVTILPREEKHLDTDFSVDIKYAIGSTIQYASADVQIMSSNPAQPGIVSLTTATAATTETANVNLTLERTNGTDGAVTVSVKTADGSAVAGVDYTAVDRVVSFADGQSTAQVSVPVTNRSGQQGDRTFTVNVSNAAGGAALGTNVTTTVTISDVVAPPPVEQESSGGSFGWLSLFAAGLVAIRRRIK